MFRPLFFLKFRSPIYCIFSVSEAYYQTRPVFEKLSEKRKCDLNFVLKRKNLYLEIKKVELFHDGGSYHIETSPLTEILQIEIYDRNLRHERVNVQNIHFKLHCIYENVYCFHYTISTLLHFHPFYIIAQKQ